MRKREPNGQGVDGLLFVVRAFFALVATFGTLLIWQAPLPATDNFTNPISRWLLHVLGPVGAWRVDTAMSAALALFLIASLVYDALRVVLGERASRWPDIWGRWERYKLESRMIFIPSILLMAASFLAILYVAEDRPGPSDAGRHSLSGWLFDAFGTGARPAGIAIFTCLTLLLLAACLLMGRRLRNFWGVPKPPPPVHPTLRSE